MAVKPKFFPEPAAFRAWLRKNHAEVSELWVGFHKRSTGRPSMTWPESVDAALGFGWIDGVRKSVDAQSYTIRFAPRKAGSNWSLINIRRFKELKRLGLVEAPGLRAFKQGDRGKSAAYSYEQRKEARLSADFDRQFRNNNIAFAFFQSQPPWYRRTCIWWIVSAKREETRRRRLELLIEKSERREPLPALDRTKRNK
ncbi:MAG: YdeI/OmpD-associated family protein [Terriglobales bacterium]